MIFNKIGLLRDRILLKFTKEDIDKSQFFGKVFIPRQIENEGEYQIENAEVVAVSNDISFVKVGDRVVVDYLVGWDTRSSKEVNWNKVNAIEGEIGELKRTLRNGRLNRQDKEKIQERIKLLDEDLNVENDQRQIVIRNKYFIEEDEQGNQYRWCNSSHIYAIIKGNTLLPSKGWVFCYNPEKLKERKKNGIILLEEKLDTDKQAIQMKVRYISRQDNTDFKVGDTIFVQPKMDFRFSVNGKKVYAAPLDKVMAYY